MKTLMLITLLWTLPGALYAQHRNCTHSTGWHRLQEPALLHVKVVNGQIMERSASGTLRGTSTLKSDLVGLYSCPNGVSSPTVIVRSMSYKKVGTTEEKARTAVRFKNVPLATAAQLLQACGGSKSPKRHDIKVRLQATCGGTSPGCTVKSANAKMRLYVTCSGSATPAVTSSSGRARSGTLVDCSKKEFKKTATPRSLISWTTNSEKTISDKLASGVYPEYPCKRAVSFRGSAHCQLPNDTEIRAALARVLKLCKKPKVPTTGTLVNCKDKRFQRPGVSIKLLLSWTEMSLRALDGLRPDEAFRIKPNCDSAVKHAGTAHCKAPGKPEPRAALARVRKKCAAVRGKYAAAAEKEKADAAARISQQKANRKIVKFPRSTYRGGGATALRRAMKKALLASRLAKSSSEVLKVQPMGRWQKGVYRGTRKAYKRVSGIVLWWDKDKDGVCRFVTYNFAKDRVGGRWSPLRAKSFCMGCPEGWVRCK